MTRRSALPGNAVVYPLPVVYGNTLSMQILSDVVLSCCWRPQLSVGRQMLQPLLLPQPICTLPSLRQTANGFEVEYSTLIFFHFFIDSGGLRISSQALSLEGALKIRGSRTEGKPGQHHILAFFLIQGETRFSITVCKMPATLWNWFVC